MFVFHTFAGCEDFRPEESMERYDTRGLRSISLKQLVVGIVDVGNGPAEGALGGNGAESAKF
jgi:hypothetical protein